MPAKWQQLCRAKDFVVEGDKIDVRFTDERRHFVQVVEHEGHYELRTIVARRKALEHVADPALKAWRRNRSLALVGFQVDPNGRIVGASWVPKAGLTAPEFEMYVRTVARESDRFEFLLTGADVE